MNAPALLFSSPLTTAELARRAGLAWVTARNALKGQGTIASLDLIRRASGFRWIWSPSNDAVVIGRHLADRRKAKGLSQRAMARRLQVSPQTIVTLETTFRGRIETLQSYLRVIGIHEILMKAGPSRRLVPGGNPAEADRVFTPAELAAAIIETFSSEIAGTVLDPARGAGAFFNAFPQNVVREWCEVDAGRDFFAWSRRVDWIITNPPFSRFRDFLIHAMVLADNVLFLAPLTHFTTRHRVDAIASAGFGVKRIVLVPTPSEWPSSGFQLAAVHLARDWRGGIAIHPLSSG